MQKAMMAMQLMQMMQKPQMEQQGMMNQQNQWEQEQQMKQQALLQQRKQQELQQQELQKQGILEALTRVSSNPMTGAANPRMVLDYLRQNFGVNIQQPQQQVDPATAYFNQQQGGTQ